MPTSGTTAGSTHWRRSRCRRACRSSVAGAIPLRIDGRLSSISGGLWHADNPSIVWFWPIVVVFVCALAAWRVRRPELDRLVARVLAITALIVDRDRWSRSSASRATDGHAFPARRAGSDPGVRRLGAVAGVVPDSRVLHVLLDRDRRFLGRRGNGDDAAVRLRPAPATGVLGAIGDRTLSRTGAALLPFVFRLADYDYDRRRKRPADSPWR